MKQTRQPCKVVHSLVTKALTCPHV